MRIQILSEWRPDVLLTDIAMPGEDGYALMRRVRALPSSLGSIPAVALTAFTDPQSVQDAFAAGFDAHLGKPLEPHVLADALSKVLHVRRISVARASLSRSAQFVGDDVGRARLDQHVR